MKVRKQYLIFLGVILFCIVLILISKFTKSSKSMYNRDDVMFNFDSNYATEDSSDFLDEENYSTDLGENDYSSEFDSSSNYTDIIIEDTSEEVVNTEEVISTEEATDINETIVDSTEELITDSDSDSVVEYVLDQDSIMTIVRYYVCNLDDDEGFEALLTKDLIDDRPNRLNSEPYTSLNGLTSLNALSLEGSIVTLVTKDNASYSFKCTFTDAGDYISGIEYIE